MKTLITFAFSLISSLTMAQMDASSITTTVDNARNDNGTIQFALYQESNFMRQPTATAIATIENGVATVTFDDVPEGEYAIVCYHDANENNTMDFQANGMPIEDYGTSNNVMVMGPPSWADSKFEVKENLEIKIRL